MPLTAEQKNWALQQAGYNPAEYALDDNGFAYPKASAQPAAMVDNGIPQPVVPATKPTDTLGQIGKAMVDPFGTLGTALGTFLEESPSALASGGAFAATSAPLWAPALRAAPRTRGLSLLAPLGVGMASAMGANVLTKAAQEPIQQAVLPDVTERLHQSQAINPKSAMAGGIATLPLTGMNPNPMNVARAARTGMQLATKMGATAPEVANLANVGIGAGLAPIQAAGMNLLSGQPVDPKQLMLEAVLGALFNKPNALGRAYGFPDSSAVQELPDVRQTQQRGQAAPVATKPAEDPINTQPTGYYGNDPLAVINRIKQTTGPIVRGPRGVERDVPYLKAEDLLSAQEAAQQTKPIERASLDDVSVAAAQGDLVRSAHNWEIQRQLREQAAADRTKAAQIEAETARRELEDSMRRNQIATKPEQTVSPRVVTEQGREIYNDYTGMEPDYDAAAIAKQEEADVTQHRLEQKQDVEEGLQPEYEYYSERLINPELLANAEVVKYANNPAGELAVPVGGSRRSGSVGSAGLTRNEATAIFNQLKDQSGYPGLRIVSKNIKGKIWYAIQWGEALPTTHPFNPASEEWKALGDQFGYKRAQKQSLDSLKTELQKEVEQGLADENISTTPGEGWNELFAAFGIGKRGVREVKTGTPVKELGAKGVTRTAVDAEGQIQDVAVELSEAADLSTAPHEIAGHVFLNQLRQHWQNKQSGKRYVKRDAAIYERAMRLAEQSPEFQRLQKERGWNVDEFLASQQGFEYVKQKVLSKEGEWRSWWNTFKAHIKHVFGPGGNEADIRRLLLHRFETDPVYQAKKGQLGQNVVTTQRQGKEIIDSEWNEGDVDEGGDGYWIQLKPGWTVDDVTAIHEKDKRTAYSRLKDAKRTGQTQGIKEGLGGQESFDYSPEDLALYQRLKARQLELVNAGKVMDKDGNMLPEFRQVWQDFENVRNKYNGMPPKQIQMQGADEGLSYNTPPKNFWMNASAGLTRVTEHYQGAKEYLNDRTLSWDDAYTRMFNQGFIRIIETPAEILFHGNANNKQLAELKNLAIEKKKTLLTDSTGRLKIVYDPTPELHPDNKQLQGSDEGLPSDLPEVKPGENLPKEIKPVRSTLEEGTSDEKLTKAMAKQVSEQNQGEDEGLPADPSTPRSVERTIYNNTGIVGRGILHGLAAEVDKVRALNKTAGDAAEEFYRQYSRNTGKWEQSLIRDLLDIRSWKMNSIGEVWNWLRQDNADFQAVVKYRDAIQDGETPPALTPLQKQINDAVQKNLDLTLAEREARPGLAHLKRGGKGYLPHTMSREAATEIFEHPDSAKSRQYKKDFYAYQRAMEPNIADTEIASRWNLVKSAGAKEQHNLAQQFGPIDKAAGVGLPKSMREQNLLDRMSRFNRRYARRLAFYDTIDKSNPANKAAADAFFGEEGVETTQAGKNVLEDIYGVREHNEAKRTALLGIIRAGMLGPLTGAKDVLAGQTLGLQYQDISQILPAKMNALQKFRDNIRKASDSGVVRLNIAGMEMGNGGLNSVINVLQRARDVINTVQGRQMLETTSRVMNFGEGQYLATDALNALKLGKLTGQKREFLNKFVKDWQKFRDQKNLKPTEADVNEAAARYVEAVQGQYDYRGLPAVAMRGTFSPYLALARWNIEKFNNFTKHVVDPALNGNIKPFLVATLGMLIGGTAVTKLVEEVTGRKQKTPTWKEVEMSENQKTMLAYKMAGLASMAGYGGALGDVIKMSFDKKMGNRMQAWGNPLVEGVSTLAQDSWFVAEALANGDVPSIVDTIDMLMQDYFQAYRIMAAQMGEETGEQLDRANMSRDLKVFNQGQDYPVQPARLDRPNPLLNKDMKEFKRTDDLGEAVEMLPQLVQQALDRAGDDPEKLRAELLKLKLNSYQTMPSPESMPMKFSDYYRWLEETQGSEEAQKRLEDFLKQRALNKAKGSIIPSL